MVRTFFVLAALVGLAAPVSARQEAPLAPQPIGYELDLVIDYEENRIDGTARIAFENRGDTTLDELPLLLYRTMTVEEVLDATGHTLGFEQVVTGYEEFPAWQVNAMRVRLPEGVEPGARGTIRLRYGGWLFGYPEIFRYVKETIDPAFTLLRTDGYAYPQIGVASLAVRRATPLPAFDYRVRIRVPAEVTASRPAPGEPAGERVETTFRPVVANGGRLVSREIEGDHVVWTYVNRRPAWRMDFAIADYGVLESGDDRVYWLPGDSVGAVRVMRALSEARRLYTSWFGPLVDDVGYAVIEIPEGMGSQADVTSVIQTAAAFRDPERVLEMYHGVSHLWHPDPTDLPSPRWNEGMASFLESYAAERIDGGDVLEDRVDAVLADLRQRLARGGKLDEVPMVEYGAHGMTDASYRVGMIMFYLIHEVAGHDAFGEIVGRFYRRHARTGGSTADFVALAREIGGLVVGRILDDWLMTTAWSDPVAAGATREELLGHYGSTVPSPSS